jgi:hypothetical protein
MPATNHDDLTWGEIARVVGLGVRIQHRKARGKGTKRLEKRAEKITAQAQEREAAERRKKK